VPKLGDTLLVVETEHEWRFYRPGKAGDKCADDGPILLVEGCWVFFSSAPR